jgi:hypothetical protein
MAGAVNADYRFPIEYNSRSEDDKSSAEERGRGSGNL